MAKDANKSGGSKTAKPSEAEIAARRAAKSASKDKGDILDTANAGEIPPPRLKGVYSEKIVPALAEKFGFKNKFAVPRLEKIVISMGVGKFATAGGEGKAKIDQAEKELAIIAGQKPVRCKAKKSVASYKVREGMETGLKVTLRAARMWEFLDRLITLALPRVKDFRGVNPNAFDNDGNYNFGINEQTVFPEIEGATVNFQQGMNITIVTTAKEPDHGREMLKLMGFPFRDDTKAR
jgi:large subunit ribosomal protein L5